MLTSGQMLQRFFALLLIVLSTGSAVAQQSIVYHSSEGKRAIGEFTTLYDDESNALSLQEVIDRNAFVDTTETIPWLGLSPSSVWVRVPITNQSESPNLVLDLAQPTLDQVEFYQPDSSGNYSSLLVGEVVAFDAREYNDPNYIFPISIPVGDTRTFYLKIQSKEHRHLALYLGTPEAVYGAIKTKDLAWGMFVGIMLVMALYNLFVYFTVRDRSYLYYVVYIIIVMLTQTSISGYSFQYLYPDWPWMAIHQMFIFPCLVGIVAMEFMRIFLQTKRFAPKLEKVFFVFYGIYGLVMVLALAGYYQIGFLLLEANAGMVSVYMLWLAIKFVRDGHRVARFFLFAWTMFLVGVLTYVGMDNHLINASANMHYMIAGGAAAETVLLSFGLADRINVLKREKAEADSRALESLQENERILSDQNVVLDRKVKERTTELETAMVELKETQAQLVQAEKMSSLGQLTAGIAHEINNSINFVTACTKPLKRDVADILAILTKYDELSADELSAEKRATIDALKKELEMDVLIEEIDSSLHSIDEGAHRTLEIAAGLKTFSRLDEDGWANADLIAGIDSTLKLLETSLESTIRIERDYEQLPKFYCQAGKLNQVFMNLCNNSVAAINDRKPEEGGRIAVRVRKENNEAIITIADNGTGMEQATMDKMFDPFFTTKDVGEGTGLGLSITHGIINNHKGSIIAKSIVGEGTQMIIRLPLDLNR